MIRDLRRELNKYRKRTNISQEELARAIGVSRMTLYRWFTGEYYISRRAVERVMTVIKINRCPYCNQKL